MTTQVPGASENRYDVLDKPAFQWRDLLLRWEVILLIMLGATIAINTLVSPYFLDMYNLADASFNFSEKAIMALAMALLILVREIDLSVAAIVALSAMAIGYGAQMGAGPFNLLFIALAVGMACGVFNGVLVTALRLPAIVVTIGTMSLFRGITQVVMGDQALTKYPPNYTELGQSYFVKMPPIPLSFIIFLALALVFGIVLHRTAAGRKLYAIGSNPVAARFSGIPVDRIRLVLFGITGLLAGLAAWLLTARLGTVRSNIAIGWELDVITMVILGGVSIAGGVGSILGLVLAVFVIGLITFGMSLNNIPGIVVSVYMGALLVLSLALPIVARRFLNRQTV
jgi:rhamnose transport system permease protein